MKTKLQKDTYSVSKPSKLVFQRAKGPKEGGSRKERGPKVPEKAEIAAKKKLTKLFEKLYSNFIILPKQRISIMKGSKELVIYTDKSYKIHFSILKVGNKTPIKKYVFGYKLDSNYDQYLDLKNIDANKVLKELSSFNPSLQKQLRDFQEHADKAIDESFRKAAKPLLKVALNTKEQKDYNLLVRKTKLTPAEKKRLYKYDFKITLVMISKEKKEIFKYWMHSYNDSTWLKITPGSDKFYPSIFSTNPFIANIQSRLLTKPKKKAPKRRK